MNFLSLALFYWSS